MKITQKEQKTLSDKIAITNFTTVTNFIRVKDVKEFIKQLKYKFFADFEHKIINQLAGDKLI